MFEDEITAPSAYSHGHLTGVHYRDKIIQNQSICTRQRKTAYHVARVVYSCLTECGVLTAVSPDLSLIEEPVWDVMERLQIQPGHIG